VLGENGGKNAQQENVVWAKVTALCDCGCQSSFGHHLKRLHCHLVWAFHTYVVNSGKNGN